MRQKSAKMTEKWPFLTVFARFDYKNVMSYEPSDRIELSSAVYDTAALPLS